MRHAIGRSIFQMMQQDPSIICIGEDIAGGTGEDAADELGGPFGVTVGLKTHLGCDRVIDTPISETAFVGMAIGAAMTGLRPIVEVMFCDFVGVCFDQILNQAAKARFLSNGRLKMPLVIRTTMGAGDGSGAMHSQSLHGLFASIAGLAVVCPSTPAEAAGLLKSAVYSDDPVVFLENKQLYDYEALVDEALPPVPLGKARVIREGEDLTIVAVSALVHKALEVAESLEHKGISATVIDPRTIKPLDWDMLEASVRQTGRLIVVDEGAAFAGFADAVISGLTSRAFEAFKTAPRKITPPDTPVPYAVEAEKEWLPGVGDIMTAAAKLMES